MLFITIANIDLFLEKNLVSKIYRTVAVLFSTKKVKIINKFACTGLKTT